MNSAPNLNTYHHYIYFWIGQLFSILGSSVVQFAIPVYIANLYQDEVLTSIIFFVSFIPPILITPIAGVFADKLNRKKMIFFADTMQAFTTLLLIFSFVFGFVNFFIITIINFTRSIFQQIHMPPSNAIIPTMVPKEKLSRMIGVSILFASLINVISPVMAGTLLFLFPIHIALWTDLITYFIAIVPLILIKIPDIREKSDLKPKSSFIKDLVEGAKFLRMVPGLFVLLMLATTANFFIMPYITLSSNFILVDNYGNNLIFAFVSGSFSLGLLMGGIVVTLKKNWKRKIYTIYLGILLENIGYIIIAISPYRWFLMIMFGSVLFGLFFPIVNTNYFTIIQTKVPPDKQGRVISISIMISSAISPISIIIAGPLSKLFGIASLWLLYALLSIIVTNIFWFFTDLRKLEKVQYDEEEKFASIA